MLPDSYIQVDCTRKSFPKYAREAKWQDQTIDAFLNLPGIPRNRVNVGKYAILITDWPEPSRRTKREIVTPIKLSF